MPHGGYHGTQIIGGKITQLGDEFKDSQGNIKPQFNVTGDKDSGFNVSMAQETFNPRSREAMYASPDDILQNIIDRKDVLKLQASPDRPGMNLYQDTIQDFRTSSPTNMAAYGQRFPITQFMMETPRKIAENTLFGNLVSSLNQSFTGAKNKTSDFSRGLFPQGLFPGLGPTIQGFAEDLSNVPSGIKKDMNNFKGLFRELTGTKKNTAEDLAPGSMTDEPLINSVTGDKFRKNLEAGDPLGIFDQFNYFNLPNPYQKTLETLNLKGKKDGGISNL
tara:strand:+ start:286 stop:1113 length:828 start_codon:yes stop_codon:yes gene_type:complete